MTHRLTQFFISVSPHGLTQAVLSPSVFHRDAAEMEAASETWVEGEAWVSVTWLLTSLTLPTLTGASPAGP